ncbi:MAG: DUF1588 domain-containing protein [Myxococcota bacterium]|nr:DUF1588 domain-containing protein [Myxococcota bacterium]
MTSGRSLLVALVLGSSTCIACTGVVESNARGPRGAGRDREVGIDVRAVTTAIPRLSVREVDATLADVLGVEGAAARHLPPDPATATSRITGAEEELFDTDALTKTPSQVFVEGLEAMAFEVARDFVADPARVAELAPCAETADVDPSGCLDTLARTVALRLWRRPMESDEAAALVALAMPFVAEADFLFGARLVVQSIVQSPELVYRTEIGTDAGDGLRRLEPYELLARASYFLWGSAPTPALLERVGGIADEGGGLDDATLATLAREMAADPRADEQMRRFHRMWLRYDRMLVTDAALAADMLAESDALLDRALFEDDASWRDLFVSTESFVTPALATHYGLATTPAEPGWVAYDDAQRAGLLTHGSFLSLSSTRTVETLPSRRGAMIARRILCIPILPPPADVDIDDGVEVAPGACKSDAYEAHRSRGACAGCHAVIDGIGFGFERFDGLGRYREVETENASCAIEGTGSMGSETFASPRELTSIVDGSGDLAQCGVEHVVRFAQRHAAASGDRALIARLQGSFEGADHDFRALMIAVVLDPAFRLRREDDAP